LYVIPVVSFIGHQGSGKTMLLARLIPLLLDRGYRVGTVKHAPHEETLDRPDKDSTRHRSAGAERTLVIGGSSYGLFWEPSSEESIEETVERCFQGFDLVLVEGFKHGPFPKVEVYCQTVGVSAEPLAGQIDVVAVVTDEHVALPDGVAVFSHHRLEDIADFLEQSFL
jgi:molybdopterin-guanine dinucleotide biosynthesis protein B